LSRIEGLLRPDVMAALPEDIRLWVQESVRQGVQAVFWTVLAAAALCFLVCCLIPGDTAVRGEQDV
jgi:hypothetical protein